MYVALLAGCIASGKSTVARFLEDRGVIRIDLDQLSREVCGAGSDVCARIAEAFGSDVLDSETGELRRDVLAQRAFATEEGTRQLEAIVHPAIRALLSEKISNGTDFDVCVVEVPLLDRVEDLIPMADEVMCVVCPYDVRRERALARGMQGADFDARAALQPSEAYLREHATFVIENDKDEAALFEQLDAWWHGCNVDEWSAS